MSHLQHSLWVELAQHRAQHWIYTVQSKGRALGMVWCVEEGRHSRSGEGWGKEQPWECTASNGAAAIRIGLPMGDFKNVILYIVSRKWEKTKCIRTYFCPIVSGFWHISEKLATYHKYVFIYRSKTSPPNAKSKDPLLECWKIAEPKFLERTQTEKMYGFVFHTYL